mmetsp:Transcript_18229/g.45322  ORF Transcript_18229/g.45322 Transcript_18229/m.45322 type:complete len:349 (-) Transcript_18229:256-1302(-)
MSRDGNPAAAAGTAVAYRPPCVCLAELPAVVAVDARHERGHGLVRRPRLQLVVRAHALAALPALERIRRRLLLDASHRLVGGVLADLLVVGPLVVAAQVLGRQLQQVRGGDEPVRHTGAQVGVLGVLQVERQLPELGLVLLAGVAPLGAHGVLDGRGHLRGVLQASVHTRPPHAQRDGLGQQLAGAVAQGVAQRGAQKLLQGLHWGLAGSSSRRLRTPAAAGALSPSTRLAAALALAAAAAALLLDAVLLLLLSGVASAGEEPLPRAHALVRRLPDALRGSLLGHLLDGLGDVAQRPVDEQLHRKVQPAQHLERVHAAVLGRGVAVGVRRGVGRLLEQRRDLRRGARR